MKLNWPRHWTAASGVQTWKATNQRLHETINLEKLIATRLFSNSLLGVNSQLIKNFKKKKQSWESKLKEMQWGKEVPAGATVVLQ